MSKQVEKILNKMIDSIVVDIKKEVGKKKYDMVYKGVNENINARLGD